MKLLFFFFSILTGMAGFSQLSGSWYTEIQPKIGFLIPHRSVMSHLPGESCKAIEITIGEQQIEGDWSLLYRGPMRGLTFKFQNFGNRDVLGTGWTIAQHTTFPLLSGANGHHCDFRLSAGLSYITKKYDPIENPKNNAIGSDLNGYVNFQLTYRKHFDSWFLGAGAELSHYSNCATIKPNLGLNVASFLVSIGFMADQRIVPSVGDFKSRKLLKQERNYDRALNFTLITTTKQNLPGYHASKSMIVLGIQSLFTLPVNMRWNGEFALDLIYNSANRVQYDDKTFTALETFQIGVYSGLTANMTKTQVYFGLGGYLKNDINPAGYIYNRIGYRYHFNSQFNAVIGIMANLGIADFLEFGIGYRFNLAKGE